MVNSSGGVPASANASLTENELLPQDSPLDSTTSTSNNLSLAKQSALKNQMKKMYKKREETKSNEEAEVFHPAILFCGECASCAAPPPPIRSASFTISDDDEFGQDSNGLGPLGNNASEFENEENIEKGSSSLRLRVYNLDHNGRRRNVLNTLLKELDGVTIVTVTDSHISYNPSTENVEDDVEAPTATTNARNNDMVDPISCMVLVQYSSSSLSRNQGQELKDNPQEPNQADINNAIVQSVKNRLVEAGFDYAMLSHCSNNSHAITETVPVNSNASMLVCPSTPSLATSNNINDNNKMQQQNEPPPSCRTRLKVQGICCSSEIPAIRSILKPLPGVRKIGINVATKVVYVDHDPSVIKAALLMKALNEERFGAQILRDGELDLIDTDGGCCTGKTCCDASSTTATSNGAIQEVPRSRFVESTIVIPGMITFANKSDLNPIENLMRQNFFKGHLRSFHLHGRSRTLKVEHDPKLLSAEKIRSVLVRGLKGDVWGSIELAHDGAIENLTLPIINSDIDDEEGNIAQDETEKWMYGLKYNVVISGIFWVLSLLSFIGGDWEYLKYAGIGAVIFGMPPVVMKAWMTVRRSQFDANCMMVIAAFGALALGEFDEAASVAFLFSISEWLEARATGKARDALGAICSLRPDYANMVDAKAGVVIVPAAKVPIGSLVSVRTGDKVPADGVVVEGTSSVDESSLTGEARPVDKRAGDEVTGGSINVGSTQLVVRTTSTVGDSTLSRLIQLVEEAQANRSETEMLVDSFARKYTPFVLVIAFFLCTVPWFFGEEAGRYWTLNGLIIIVVACPCALTISTPVTYSAGLAATAQRGIIIKGGSRLEALGNVKTVVFDKTGTLTQGRFTLLHLELIGEEKTRQQLLELLAIMEGPSSHPLSATLVSAAKAEGVVIPENISVKEHTILKGEGVQASVDNKTVYVGNERLFKRLGMYDISQQHLESAIKWSNEGGTIGYVGIDGVGIVGMFCVADTVREEALDVVSTLVDSGIDVIMLTGDGEGAAQAVGREIGLPKSSIQSQLLPEDKLHYVSGLKGSPSHKKSSLCGGKGLVLMVGDGVNDAPALAVADVGVAMGQGAALAMEMGDVTLMDSNLSKLLFSMRMGSKVILTVKENIIFACLANSIAIVLTFAGKMTLLLAIASDVGVMLIVTLNGMKLLSSRTIHSMEVKQVKSPASKRKNGNRYDIQSTEDVELEII